MNRVFSHCCRVLCALAFAALLIAAAPTTQSAEDWRVPARSARKKNPLTPDEASIAVGKDFYNHQCVSCHGETGHGDGRAAKDLDPKPHDLTAASVTSQTDGALFWRIAEGHRPMPGFEPLISEDGRWHVVLYLRALAPATPATQASTQPTSQP